MALARLKSVAGVIIPDTALCKAAVECWSQVPLSFSARIVSERTFSEALPFGASVVLCPMRKRHFAPLHCTI